jgi:hypothetical protein
MKLRDEYRRNIRAAAPPERVAQARHEFKSAGSAANDNDAMETATRGGSRH